MKKIVIKFYIVSHFYVVAHLKVVQLIFIISINLTGTNTLFANKPFSMKTLFTVLSFQQIKHSQIHMFYSKVVVIVCENTKIKYLLSVC